MKTAIGIDIGGTKIAAALADGRGRVLDRFEIPTAKNSEIGEGVRRLAQSLLHWKTGAASSGNRLIGIGVGMPGAVNPESGRVPRSPHMKGWEGFPLKGALRRALKVPVAMTNDANAAALGEKFFGAGRGARDFIYMTISTGIGGGIVIGGKLLEGSHFAAGEVGHMAVVADGEPCPCGRKGCLEAYASGTALARYAARQLRSGRRSKIAQFLGRGGRFNARMLGQAARRGDPLALETYRQGGYYLGIGIANLLNLLNPERVILGGGVLKSAPPVFWRMMLKGVRAQAWPEALRGVKILRSKLGDEAGLLGAAALAFERFQGK